MESFDLLPRLNFPDLEKEGENAIAQVQPPETQLSDEFEPHEKQFEKLGIRGGSLDYQCTFMVNPGVINKIVNQWRRAVIESYSSQE